MHLFEWGGVMGSWMVLWWVLPILGIVVLATWIGRADSRRQEKTALDILKERYARGEIDQVEFQRKIRDLGR